MNIEIERKYFSDIQIDIKCDLYKSFTMYDRYYKCPSGFIRVRSDTEEKTEITAKNYPLDDNIYRREVNLGQKDSIENIVEFMDVAGLEKVLEFKQKSQVWITKDVCISRNQIVDINDIPYYFDGNHIRKNYLSYPKAIFIEIEAYNNYNKEKAFKDIDNMQRKLKLEDSSIIKKSLVQLFGIL